MSNLMSQPRGNMPRHFQKTDWSEEQKKFREMIPTFLKNVECANVIVPERKEGEEVKKSSQPQPVEDDDFISFLDEQPEESAKKVQESDASFVESRHAEETSTNESASLHEPNEPKIPEEPEEPEMPPEDLYAVSGADPLKNIFDDGESVKVEQQAFSDAAADVSAEDLSSPLEEEGPSPDPAKTPEDTQVKNEEKKTAKKDSPRPVVDPLKNFDFEGFKDMQAIAERMLSGVDRKLDLDLLEKQLDDYYVVLNLDAERENIEELNNGMIRVQAAIDSVSTVLKKLVPLANELNRAWDWLEDTGIAYANATNREKREAQVKIVLKEFWLEVCQALRVRQSYENRQRELKGQWETISRLMTFDQYRTQYYKDVHRPELPFESRQENKRSAMEASKRLHDKGVASTKPVAEEFEADPVAETKKIQKEQKAPNGDDGSEPQDASIFEQKANEPLEPEKHKHLDAFPADAEKLANVSGSKKGFVDWDF